MDKINRSRRIHYLLQFIPEDLAPQVGIYFGEHVVRVEGQLCLVVTLDGDVGIRATDPELEAELLKNCGQRNWVAHGRVYEQWYLLPGDQALGQAPVTDWIRQSAEGSAALARREEARMSR